MSRTNPSVVTRITLREVAQHLGVSVATVSNAYNRPDQLSAELRARVMQAAQELGYGGPNPLARSLRQGKTGVVGVVYDAPLEYAFADPAAALFLGSVAHTIQREGLNVLLLASPAALHPDARPIRAASVDGLIVYSAPQNGTLLQAVLGRGLPTVLVDQHPLEAVRPAVRITIDDEAGAYAAAAHLQELGHQHIGVLALALTPEKRGGPITPLRESRMLYHNTAQRLRGYRRGAPQATLYPVEAPQNTPAEGQERALYLLRTYPQMTALLCMSDVLAQGAWQAAQVLGRQVPDDLSLIGYDDLPLSEALGLSTIWQPTAQKGQHVGEALLSLVRGEAVQDEVLPTRLIKRQSTATPAIR